MEIKSDKRCVSGEHNGESFTYDGGILYAFGTKWSKTQIKSLVEIANLLEIQAFKLQLTLPKTAKKYSKTSWPFISFDDAIEEE